MTVVARVVQDKPDTDTADNFLDDEASAQDSEPRELVQVSWGNTQYLLTSASRDVFLGGTLYKAVSLSRGSQMISGAGKSGMMELTLPIDHPIVKRYVQLATPPRQVTVAIIRLQVRSGLTEFVWQGDVTSMSCNDEGTEASFAIPSRGSDALLRVIPNVTVSNKCPHVLYGPLCQAIRGNAMVATTAMSVNGRDVLVDLADVGKLGDWAVGGTLLHISSGERMTIAEQQDLGAPSTLTHLFMQSPIIELKVGDSIEVDAGCKRDVETCDVKFLNRQNFGVFPELATKGVSIACFTPMDRE